MIIERVVEKMYKILVVDDAGFMRMMIKTCLTKSGYPNVIEGEDGEKAIALYKAEKPDLVFMDITMPNLDGIGALKGIKEVDPNAKVVMCSAMGQEAKARAYHSDRKQNFAPVIWSSWETEYWQQQECLL